MSKVSDRATKRAAILLWVAISLSQAGALIVPYYWFWDRLSARTDMLILITGLLLWAEWNWWRLSSGVIGRIGNLPEPPAEGR